MGMTARTVARAAQLVKHARNDCGSLDHLRLQRPLDDLAARDAHEGHLRTLSRRDDAPDLVVLEIDPGVVVAGVPWLHLAGSDQLHVQRPTILFCIVVRAMAALEETEAVHDRQLLRP